MLPVRVLLLCECAVVNQAIAVHASAASAAAAFPLVQAAVVEVGPWPPNLQALLLVGVFFSTAALSLLTRLLLMLLSCVQAAVVETPLVTVGGCLPPNLRALLLVGVFFLDGVIAVSLTKRVAAPPAAAAWLSVQAAVVETPLVTVGGPLPPNLRALLLVGDFFLGGVIAVSLTKLLLRLRSLGTAAPMLNKAVAQGMLAIISIMRLGESPALPTPLDGECTDPGGGGAVCCVRCAEQG